jgi:hypothetical protein
MKTVGVVTSVLGLGVVAVAAYIGVRSIPDVKRYLAMRRM